MTVTKTPAIPPSHPLQLLLDRSKKANKLPSCEGCKSWTRGTNDKHRGDCVKPSDPDKAFTPRYEGEIVTRPTHFCAAWEAKA